MFTAFSVAKFLSNSSMLVALRNSYKSSISLDKLYPKSNLDILAKPQIKTDEETFSGYIPIEKLEISKKTCSKPGGQNVNKSIEIRFNVESADWIPKWIRDKLKETQINRMNKEGYLIFKSEKTRKAILNQADCLEQIRAVLFEAAKKPRGLDEMELNKIETDKKIAEGRRLITKKKRSEQKSQRRNSVYDAAFDYYEK